MDALHERVTRSRTVRVAMATVGVAGICAAALHPAHATSQVVAGAPANKIDKQVAAADDDLAAMNTKVNGIRKQLAAATTQLGPAEARYAAANQRVATARAAEAEAAAAAVKANAAVTRAQSQINATNIRIEVLKAQIGAIARAAYTTGGASGFEEIEIVLESADPSQFADRLAALKRVSRGNNKALASMARLQLVLTAKFAEAKTLQDDAARKKAAAFAKASEANAALNDAVAAKKEVDALVAQRKRILNSASSERDRVKKQYDALLAEQQKIADEAAKHNGGGGRKGGHAGANVPSGSLRWPTPGTGPGGRTGWRIHPVYGYHSCHTGDDIGAGYGTPIHAAASGRVISVDGGGPYGLHTLIGHGAGLSTMYAHQSGVNVSSGQRVRRGQVIGYVGASGWVTGPHLHFEVHVNGVPYEPMGWFGERKHPVDCWSG